MSTDDAVKPLVEATTLADNLSKDSGRISISIWLLRFGFVIEATTVVRGEILRLRKNVSFEDVFRANGPLLATAVQHTHDELERNRVEQERAYSAYQESSAA